MPLSPGEMACSELQDLALNLKPRLTQSLSSGSSHSARKEHKELRKALHNSPPFREELADAALKVVVAEEFSACWRPVGEKYACLRLLACGIATVFLGSSSVETDFYNLILDKSTFSSSLASFSVEGQFHARQ